MNNFASSGIFIHRGAGRRGNKITGLFVTLKFESVNEIAWCYHSN